MSRSQVKEPSLKAIMAEISRLKSRVDKAEARADRAEARADKADARADKEEARADKNEAELKELKELMGERGSTTGAGEEEELMVSYSWRWRALLLLGGSICTAFALYGFLWDDERLSWASATCWAFSTVCLIGAMAGNPRNIQSWKEKLFVSICGILMGLAPLIAGIKLRTVEHQATAYLGWFFIGLGGLYTCFIPLVFTGGLVIYSKLPDSHLSNFMKTIFKSYPQIMGSTLFVSAAGTRCLMTASLSSPIAKQCGNPTIPSVLVSVFLMFTFFLGYVVPPLLFVSGRKVLTWADVMAIRMSKLEGTQFMLFGILATLALVLFATTDEDGGDFNLFLQYLTLGFLPTIVSLLFLVIYEYIAKPNLSSSSTASISSENSHELNNSDSFNVKDSGALSIGGLI